jgi:hypothetical protein
MDIVRYTVEQRAFLYESHLTYSFTRKCWRKCTFTGITVSSTAGIHEGINWVRTTGQFWTTNLPKSRLLVEEKLKIRAGLERTPWKSLKTPCTRDWHLENFSSQSEVAA